MKRFGARGTLEALVARMPVLALVGDLALLDADDEAARGAQLGVLALEARATVRPRLLDEVALAAQQLAAVGAREMRHVPRAALRFRTLVREDELVARRTPRLHQLGVVSSTIHFAVLAFIIYLHHL